LAQTIGLPDLILAASVKEFREQSCKISPAVLLSDGMEQIDWCFRN